MESSESRLKAIFFSPIGKKIFTGITGIGLTVFALVHMLGNLTFFSPNVNAYNEYAHTLLGLGPILYVVEIGLILIVVVHIVLGINIYLRKRQARPEAYVKHASAGGQSRLSTSSRSMIVTGLILMVFIVVHVITFKYGPGIDAGYVVDADGVVMRDLRRLMVETFQHPAYAFGYPIVMILLGVHLRHGIWSALQSLGAMTPRLSPVIYSLGGIIAVLLALGFLVLPLWVYFSGGSV